MIRRWQSLGCVARAFRTYDAYQRAFEIAASDNFGVCLCIGTWAEGGKQGFGKDSGGSGARLRREERSSKSTFAM